MKTTRITQDGGIILPAKIRKQDDVRPGQSFIVRRIARGQYTLIRDEPRANVGLVDWLLACPEKGFFVPLESESTDVLWMNR